MANIIDYIKWRGDVSLKESKFNNVDNLVLSCFAYFPFDNLISKDEKVSIRELSERFERADVNNKIITKEENKQLFSLMGKSKRFGNMIASRYVNEINLEEEKQFSAITINMLDNTIFVAYRGTDNTIIGWKEDFNLGFKSNIASQMEAKKYLEETKCYFWNKIRIGGHSKGGNLAVYAAIFSSKKKSKKIINVYNNDGPGFSDEIIKMPEYINMIDRVHTFIPQTSVVGRLLNHEEKHTIVHSTQKGIMQHDLYSWQVLGKEFICLDEVTSDSEIVDKTIKAWFYSISNEEREQVVEAVFEILGAMDTNAMPKTKESWFSNMKLMYGKYQQLDEEKRKMIMKTVQALLKLTGKSISDELFIQK